MKKTLKLKKQTIRTLQDSTLEQVAGGLVASRDCQSLTCPVTAKSLCELKCYPSDFTCF